MPQHTKPRYLMGVGYERDIVSAVMSGVDMFDCVLPTRNGRNANAFTTEPGRNGQLRLRNATFATGPAPDRARMRLPRVQSQALHGWAYPRTDQPFTRSDTFGICS